MLKIGGRRLKRWLGLSGLAKQVWGSEFESPAAGICNPNTGAESGRGGGIDQPSAARICNPSIGVESGGWRGSVDQPSAAHI